MLCHYISLEVLYFFNLDLTESLDNLSFLKRMNRCWQDHCRQTVSVMFDRYAFKSALLKP